MRDLGFGAAAGAMLGVVSGWLIAGFAAAGVTSGTATGFWELLFLIWGSIVLLWTGLGAAVGRFVERFGDD